MKDNRSEEEKSKDKKGKFIDEEGKVVNYTIFTHPIIIPIKKSRDVSAKVTFFYESQPWTTKSGKCFFSVLEKWASKKFKED